MKSAFIALLFLAGVLLANGHSYFSSITIDGVEHEEDDCIRPHPSDKYDYPISQLGRTNGLSTNDMTCGWLPAAANPANRKCGVNPGSSITLQWHYEMGLGDEDDFFIDPSHKGPCIVYMAKSETGAGAVWFKIFEDGYNRTTKKWCVDKLRANGGKFNVKIPTDISPGNYLFRAELIALHEGHELYGAQPYVGCAELTVGGNGNVTNPGPKVAFPGAYTPTDAGIYFNIYTGENPAYPIPGPALYVSGSSNGGSSPPPSAPATTARSTTARSTTSRSTTGQSTTARSTTARSTTARSTSARSTTARSTTGRQSTTGKVTTGRVASPPPSNPPPSNPPPSNPPPSNPPPSNGGSCTLGYQECAGTNTYKTCGWATQTQTGWSAPQSCASGLSCQPHPVYPNYIWCY